MSQIKGIDISSWQNQVDFNVLKQQLDFVIIKATESTDYINPLFSQHRVAAKAAGLALGFYHFARPEANNTPEAEADHFVNTLGHLEQGEVLALDWEPSWGGNAGDYSLRFLNRVSAHFNGIKPLIYLNTSLKNGHDWSQVINGGYGLWLADYSNNEPAHPWSVIALQQISSTTKFSGVNGNVDADIFYGDVETFKKYGFQTPVIQPPTVPTAPTVDPKDTQIQTLQNSVNSIQAQLTDKSNQFNQVTTENNDLKNQITDLNQKLLDATNKGTAIQSQLNIEQTTESTLRATIEALNKQSSVDKANHDQELIQVQNDCDLQIAQKESISQQILNKQKTDDQTIITALKQQLDKTQSHNDVLMRLSDFATSHVGDLFKALLSRIFIKR